MVPVEINDSISEKENKNLTNVGQAISSENQGNSKDKNDVYEQLKSSNEQVKSE
jgi:hypothetical protein